MPRGHPTRSGDYGFIEELLRWLCVFSSSMQTSQMGSEEMAFGLDLGWSLKSKGRNSTGKGQKGQERKIDLNTVL